VLEKPPDVVESAAAALLFSVEAVRIPKPVNGYAAESTL
jgi:hypothetical protein